MIFRPLLLAVALGTLSTPAMAREANGEAAEKIGAITFEGLRRVDEDAIKRLLKLRNGNAIDPALATEDLRALWDTGFFRDVRIERERAADGTITLIYVLQEKPTIREVSYVGRDALSEDDVSGVVDVKAFTILNVEKLKRNVEKIKNLYVEKGYYLADVTYRVEPVADTEFEVDVVFDIVENAKVLVKQLTLVGNDSISAEKIKSVLQTREGNELSWLTSSGTYKKEFFQTDLFRIQALYLDEGFVEIKVGEPTATISADRRFIYLNVPITEGLRYDFGDISFAGEIELKNEEGEVIVDKDVLRDKLTIEKGEQFNRTSLFQDIQAVTDVFRDQGYAFANVNPNSRLDRDNQIVDLELEVERGEVVYFGRIEIVGNTRTRDKVMRRELAIFEGDKYSASGINRSKARIFQLGFFEDVNITTQRGAEANILDVTVEVKERSTGTFQIGAGFSSVENFIATAQISQNNFLGNGQLLSLSAQLSFGTFARQLANFQFFEPYFLDSRWSLGFNAYITQRLYIDFQRNARGVSPSFGFPLTRNLRVSLGYTVEEVEVLQRGNRIGYYNLTRGGLSSALSASLTYDTRDNRLFPSDGQYHQARAEFSSPLIGADDALQYNRYSLIVREYVPLFAGLVFKANANFGLVTTDVNQGVPISERYFPGGIFSVRGFRPRRIGPAIDVPSQSSPDASTREFVIGGNKQAIFNLEIEFPLLKAAQIRGVIFADAGNAFNDDEGFFYLDTPKELRPKAYLLRSNQEVDLPLGLYYSVGFGFRWFSPIGPLRFEWGIPLTKRRPTDDGLIFEFTIGNLF